jgi:hypothetical protein
MIRHTKSCKSHNHPEFQVSFNPRIVNESDLCWFLDILEAVAGGERFSDGQTFQVGWIVTLIRKNQQGTLSIFEPDILVIVLVVATTEPAAVAG